MREDQINEKLTALFSEIDKLNAVMPGSADVNLAAKEDYPPQFAARLARIQAAQAALRLAAELLAMDSKEDARPILAAADQLKAEVSTWRKAGRGWFEERWIKKPYYPTQIVTDQDGNPVYLLDSKGKPRLDRDGQPIPQVDYVRDEYGEPVKAFRSFGPYHYYRYYEEGKVKTIYFGRPRPEDFKAGKARK